MTNDQDQPTDPFAWARPDAATTRLSPNAFAYGMGLLSGAFDRYPVPPEQVAARNAAYWAVLHAFPDGVWASAVRHVIATRKGTLRRDGRLDPPPFPDAADLVDCCTHFRQPLAALPPPLPEPASPDIALAWIALIKEKLARARGPLARTLHVFDRIDRAEGQHGGR